MRALVVYGTRWGGTVGIAEKIAGSLRQRDYVVDVCDAHKAPSNIDIYNLVVVGSGVRANKWTEETLSFLEKNAAKLRAKKTALFVSCQMANGEGTSWEDAKDTYLVKTSEKYGLTPVSYGFFGGILDFSRSHGFLVDIIVKVNARNLKRNGLDTRKISDTRDWGKVESWAFEMAETASKKQEQ